MCVCVCVHRYRKSLVWADSTLAHVLHTVHGVNTRYHISYDNKCGLLSYHPSSVTHGQYKRGASSWFHGIILVDCIHDKRTKNFLCQFDDPTNRTARLEITSPMSEVLSSTKRWDSNYTACPSRHVTHSFLACDERSVCWAHDTASFSSERDSWDLPSYLSCPVPGVTSLPPSFACVKGSSRVPYTFVCDYRKDCEDDSDEDFCQFAACPTKRPLQCGNIRQVVE